MAARLVALKDGTSQAAAKLANVSPRSVKWGAVVLERGIPEIALAVTRGGAVPQVGGAPG